jgi:hypothetical protein
VRRDSGRMRGARRARCDVRVVRVRELRRR